MPIDRCRRRCCCCCCCCCCRRLCRLTGQIAMGVSEEKLLPALPGNLPDDLMVIATACCDFDPHMRPSFVDIADELEKVVQQMQVGGLLQWVCCCGLSSSAVWLLAFRMCALPFSGVSFGRRSGSPLHSCCPCPTSLTHDSWCACVCVLLRVAEGGCACPWPVQPVVQQQLDTQFLVGRVWSSSSSSNNIQLQHQQLMRLLLQ